MKPTEAQVQAALGVFNHFIKDWLDEDEYSIPTEYFVELMVHAAINTTKEEE